jgi:hemerythrin
MDTNKIILEAGTIPHVDLGFMNNTHFEEIEIVKALGENITAYQQNNSEDKAKKITDSLNIWLEHTKAHFARENKLMQETHFPAYSIHSQAHEAAFNRLETITKAWQIDKNIDPVAEYVFTLWPDWFNAHVNSMDMMTARFAVMNGYGE